MKKDSGLCITKATKRIKQKNVLESITCQFLKHHIYGIVGPNGCGKTMLLRLCSGLIYADTGTVTVDQKVLGKDLSFPSSIGLIIGHMELLPQYTAFENLMLLSRIRKTADETSIRNALIRTGLNPDDKRTEQKYSLGMKQRLMIAQAIFEKPEYILLDEPTNALDSNGIDLVHNILEEEKKRGACIIVATHHKEEISDISDEILEMSEGRIV